MEVVRAQPPASTGNVSSSPLEDAGSDRIEKQIETLLAKLREPS